MAIHERVWQLPLELLVVFLSMFSPLMVELGWDPELDADCVNEVLVGTSF